jgi:hypothetical protein
LHTGVVYCIGSVFVPDAGGFVMTVRWCVHLDKYFPLLSLVMCDWVRNPFVEFLPNSQNLLSLQEEKPSELQCDQTLKIKFNEVSPDVFWISVMKEYL